MRIFGLAAIFLLTACREQPQFAAVKVLENHRWILGDSLDFSFDIQDTSSLYQLRLSVTHSNDYDFQNLYARFVTTYPDGTFMEDIVSLELGNEAGFWFGDCRARNCVLEIPLQEVIRFHLKGNYKITLFPHMRVDTVEGIDQLAFSLYNTID